MTLKTIKSLINKSFLILALSITFISSSSLGFETLDQGKQGGLDYIVMSVKAGNVYFCDAHLDQATTCEWERYYFESTAYKLIKPLLKEGYYPLFLSNEDIISLNWFDKEIDDESLTSGILVLYKGLETKEQRELAAAEIAFEYLDK